MTSSTEDDGPSPGQSGDPAKGSGTSIEAKLQAHIGRQLRLLYDQVVMEPVPERFRQLLDRLEAQEAEAAVSVPQDRSAPETEISR